MKSKLKLYNTLTRKKQEFKPLHDKKVGIYSCGPTVYWYQHIGNLRTYIFSDILKRVLTYNGYKVKHVMNVTDVGHLTSDADEGEDKVEKAAKREHKNASEIANFYWKIFKQDFEKLNIIEPNIWCKATEHIKEMQELIKKLIDKGYTYETSDGIYFDTSKLKDYGKLARLRIEKLKAGKRVAMKEKRNKTDFVLWKFSKLGEKRQQEWNFLGRKGFPGWHIECSAMSMKYLGEQFDIHTGGTDHIPVHHTNEIAQSEAATGKIPAKFWMHGAFLTFKGEKVSKSKGGLYTLAELEKKGFSSLAYRYFCLTAHYRSQLEFSLENLKNAQNSYERLKNIIAEIKDDKKINKNYLEKFEKAINNDLDMPFAISILWELVRDKNVEGKLRTIKEMDKIFGLYLLEKEKIKVSTEIKKLIGKREKLRKEKKWKEADEIREKIKSLGFYINDTKEGPKLERLK